MTNLRSNATGDAKLKSAESTQSTERNCSKAPEVLWQAAEHSLQTAFQLPKLRPAQQKVIDRLLRQRSVLAIMPTGSGKSLCYQLTSQVLPGLTLVVSPLISLMKDQCDSLAACGISAARLDQGVSHRQMQTDWAGIQAGTTKLLFVSPERFFTERFAAYLGHVPISMLAIDEAHCISQWGHHFRPDYLRLAELPRAKPILTLTMTATATKDVIRDIRKQFLIQPTDVVRAATYRSNLHLRCTLVTSSERDEVLLNRLKSRRRGATLVYVTRRRTTEELIDRLGKSGLPAVAYHAGLSSNQRSEIQQQFLASDDMILVGTVAFGMGIDKPNIRQVIHYNPSTSLESYSQEIGRGGRDGRRCVCETLLVPSDEVTMINVAAGDLPSEQSLRLLAERLQGQPERFQISLPKLAWETNLSSAVLATMMVQLQHAGLLHGLPASYDVYRIQPRQHGDAILRDCPDEHREAADAILNSLSKSKRGFRVNLVMAVKRFGIERDALLAALEQLAMRGCWELSSTGLLHAYEWTKRPTRWSGVIRRLKKQAEDHLHFHESRVAELLELLRCDRCLANGLASHFGHKRSRPCGHCTACQDEGPWETRTNFPEHLGSSAMGVLNETSKQHPDLFSDPVDRAKFLCGLMTPRFLQAKLNHHHGFGVCDHVPFQTVLRAVSPPQD